MARAAVMAGREALQPHGGGAAPGQAPQRHAAHRAGADHDDVGGHDGLMFGDIEDFLHYFRGLNRRGVRDVGGLGAAAETWRPPAGEGENAWGVGEIVAHMATSRVFFARAYVEGEWHVEPWPGPAATREEWAAALDGSAARLH